MPDKQIWKESFEIQSVTSKTWVIFKEKTKLALSGWIFHLDFLNTCRPHQQAVVPEDVGANGETELHLVPDTHHCNGSLLSESTADRPVEQLGHCKFSFFCALLQAHTINPWKGKLEIWPKGQGTSLPSPPCTTGGGAKAFLGNHWSSHTTWRLFQRQRSKKRHLSIRKGSNEGKGLG